MTANGTTESRKSKCVRNFVDQVSALHDAKVIGSSAGLKGIAIKFNKNMLIKSYSAKIVKSKIKTNVNNGKFVVLKLSVPFKNENGQKICRYFEIEYKN